MSIDSARLDLKRRAVISIAAIDVMRHKDNAAIDRLELARADMITTSSPISDFDSSLFLAELYARSGNLSTANDALDRAQEAANIIDSAEYRLIVALVSARLQPNAEFRTPIELNRHGEALWKARTAWNRGDNTIAITALNEARRHGVFESPLVDEARYLAWQLAQPAPAERAIDPPFPPLAYVVLRRDLREALPESAR